MTSYVNQFNTERISLAKKNTRRTSNRRKHLADNVYDNVHTPQPNNPVLKKYASNSTIVQSQNGLAPYRGNFTKLFNHTADGFVIGQAYNHLLKAITSPDSYKEWKDIPTVGKLVDPQAPMYATTIGYDAKSITTNNTPPSINSQESGSEMAELYCMSGCRDVAFSNYTTSNTNINNSLTYLNEPTIISFYSGPLNAMGLIDSTKLFRGSSIGDQLGPYISQFLWLPVPEMGLMKINQQLYPSPVAVDFLKTYIIWLNNQNSGIADPNGPITYNSARYIATGRDLANVVHYDDNLTWGHQIALILQNGLKCPLSSHNPYTTSNNQTGFINFGIIDLMTMIVEATRLSLLSCWYVKWNEYLKLRPEEYGHVLHMSKTDPNYNFLTNDIPTNLQNSLAPWTFANNLYGTYLLSSAYTEGSPAHPAYPSGHAVISGATATILKAWFKDTTPINTLTNYNTTIPALPLTINPSDFTSFVAYTGSDAGSMTVASELDKFATNIAFGRNFAGIHYRSDAEDGILLGEAVAIKYLKDKVKLYPKSLRFKGWKLTKRDGQVVYIND